MSNFTPEEIQALYAPFPLEAHSIREGHKTGSGKIQWFVYLDRMAVQRRLDELFPGEWEFIYLDQDTTDEITTVYAGIVIRGLRRDFNGTGKPNRRKDSDEEGIDENSPKGAMTDAFRRASSLWGLGAYMWEAPNLYSGSYASGKWDQQDACKNEAMSQFVAWYNRTFGGGSSASPQATPTTKPAPAKRTNPYQAAQQKPATNSNTQTQPGWKMNNQTEGVLIMQVKNAVDAHPAEVANTVKKMRNESAFDNCPTFDDAVALAIERVNSHKEAA